MAKKPKFKPEIRRIELNPEQAVLSCSCYQTGWFQPDYTLGISTLNMFRSPCTYADTGLKHNAGSGRCGDVGSYTAFFGYTTNPSAASS